MTLSLFESTGRLGRLKNQFIAKMTTRFPGLAQGFIHAYQAVESNDIPWTPVSKPLDESRLVLITTAGVHHPEQPPFDMSDPEGDPSFRQIDAATIGDAYTITHDYYDHTSADKDLNVVLPFERLRELKREGILGDIAERHFSFMGHIDGPHIPTLTTDTARQVARQVKADGNDIALLTPG